MVLHDAIGLDPDSRACVAALVRRDGTKPVVKHFTLTAQGRRNLAEFISQVPDVLVGIEGRRGQSSPLEEFFEREGIVYYSISALKIENYRKAMVGANKNNENDARAVSEFLLDLESKGQLEHYSQPEKVDLELRLLARQRLNQAQQITVMVNQLWKFLKAYANDLYLALNGNGDEDTSKVKLTSKRVLHLFYTLPQLGSWKDLSEEQILELSGGKKIRGWESFVQLIQSSSQTITPLGFGSELIIRQSSESLLRLLEQETELDHALSQEVSRRPQAAALVEHYKGMGAFTAALIVEEMITLDRFPNDDHLASYAGLTKRDHSTGTNTRQVQPGSCNTRLKTAFINLARGYLINNKDSHLEKYHQYLLKKGMSRMEALKRIARVLARDVYRFLKTLNVELEKEKGEPVALGSDSRLMPWSTSYTEPPKPSLCVRPISVKIGEFT